LRQPEKIRIPSNSGEIGAGLKCAYVERHHLARPVALYLLKRRRLWITSTILSSRRRNHVLDCGSRWVCSEWEDVTTPQSCSRLWNTFGKCQGSLWLRNEESDIYCLLEFAPGSGGAPGGWGGVGLTRCVQEVSLLLAPLVCSSEYYFRPRGGSTIPSTAPAPP
jgi:hypothetical protein